MAGTCRPSIDPMLMTRAGSSTVPAALSSGSRNRVRWNTPFTLRDRTRSHAASSNSSRGAPPRAHAPAQAPPLALGGQVGGQGDALPHLRQLGRHFLAHVGLAGRDVDL